MTRCTSQFRRHAATAMLGLLVTLAAPGCEQWGSPTAPPVAVSVRDSVLGKGKVLRVTNTSDAYLHQVEASVAANAGMPGRTAVIAEALAPHRTVEVGWIQLGDRELLAGERVSVRCRGYAQALTVTVPANSAPREVAR